MRNIQWVISSTWWDTLKFIDFVVVKFLFLWLLQNFFHCDVDIPVVSFNFAPKLGYPLRIGEIFFDAQCDITLLYHPY